MAVTSCPLCGLVSHPGRCARLPRGEWWCVLCLTELLSPDDIAAPQLPPALLMAAGVQRTSGWCQWCGCTICKAHDDGHHHCARPPGALSDCRSRGPNWVATIKATLEKYVPDYLTAGRARCRVCSLPAYRNKLCSRHYSAVRKGKVHIYVERQRRRRNGERMKCVSVYLTADVEKNGRALAAESRQTFALWVSERIKEAIQEKLGVNLKDPYLVTSTEE